MFTHLQDRLALLPDSPGVYEMKNEDNTSIYIGKAKSLKSRVKSYFLPSAKHSPRIKKMTEKVQNIEWTTTSSELEALVLETNLIKEKRPKFNILMRDDKNFIYIKIDTSEDFPRITTTRKIFKDKAKYFGPKTSSSSVYKTIDLLQELFKFRSTPIEIKEKKTGEVEVQAGGYKYPCLNFHLKKCNAPCIGNISKEEYRLQIDKVIDFFKGNHSPLLKEITAQMHEEAKKGNFEKAAKLRDQMRAIESTAEKQLVSAPEETSSDIIAVHYQYDRAFFHIFSLREGKVIGSETMSLVSEEGSEGIQAFFRMYIESVSTPPKNIIFPENLLSPEEQNIWERFFSNSWEQKIEFIIPQKGKRKKLLDLAAQNAKEYAQRNAATFIKKSEDQEQTLKILGEKLNISPPKRIECYDISHFSGSETVASMVVFEDGEPLKSDYRHFKLKAIKKGEIDDFKSLHEVITRRIARLPEIFPENWSFKKITQKKKLESLASKLYFKNRLTSKIEYRKEGIIKKNICSFYEITQEKSPTQIIINENKEDDTTTLLCIFSENKNEKIDKYILREIEKKSPTGGSIVINKEANISVETLESQGYNKEGDNMRKIISKGKKESFTKIPDLIVIDGGKGQLSSSYEALKNSPYHDRIKICSLAKRYEEVFIPEEKVSININKDSPEGYLLQSIRDEAHRFAITHNKQSRIKTAQKSILDEIPGIGGKTKKALKIKFGSIEKIKNATDEELLQIVSKKILFALRENL